MKLAFYCGSLSRGGAERVVCNLAEFFTAKGDEAIIVTKLQVANEYAIGNNIKRILADITKEEETRSRICNFIRRVKKLRNIWKQEKPDVIISFIGKNNMMALLSSRGMRIPVLVGICSASFREYPGVYKYIAKTLFKRAAGVITQMPEQSAYLGKKISKKAILLPNPIRPDFLDDVFSEQRNDEIVAVGRIDDNKNQIMLVEAFDLIADKFPSINVMIYGDGDAKEKVADLIRQKGLEERVILAGHQTDIKQKIQNARIFVITSKVEGVPNALMEAMALGLVPISTDFGGGGAKQLINDGENGYIVPVDDVSAMAERLERVLMDKVLEERLRNSAIESSQRFAPEVVNRQWQEYIELFVN